MSTSFLGPSSAVEIPNIKWIHVALVFFACLSYWSCHLMLLGKEREDHLLLSWLVFHRYNIKTLFLVGIWDNGALSVVLHTSAIPQTFNWCRSDLLGLLPQDNHNNFTDNCRVQLSLCLWAFLVGFWGGCLFVYFCGVTYHQCYLEEEWERLLSHMSQNE